MSRPLISIVTPVFNEQENIMRCYEAIKQLRNKLSASYDFEHIFTDNHSEDRTFSILAEIAKKDSAVRVFRFSRNFGYQRSIYQGYMKARGAAVVQFDGDLQDPADLIEEFLKAWSQGYKVVYGVRIKRKEGALDMFLRTCFYKVLNRMSQTHIPEGAGDFRLIDRVLIEELRKVKDNKIYLRGRIAEMGFNQQAIPYERNAREAGSSKFNFNRNMALAIDAILTHTVFPLRISIYFGIFVFCLSIVLGLGYLVAYFTGIIQSPPGFMTLVVLLLAHLGLTSLFLGIIGEYVARVYEHLKVPQSVIFEQVIDSHEQT